MEKVKVSPELTTLLELRAPQNNMFPAPGVPPSRIATACTVAPHVTPDQVIAAKLLVVPPVPVDGTVLSP